MAFDECSPPYDRRTNEQAMSRTHAWAQRCLNAHRSGEQALFGIVQAECSRTCARSPRSSSPRSICGIAIGGLSVGETKAEMHAMLEVVTAELPPLGRAT